MTTIDLYVFVERSIFDSDAAWLSALSTLAQIDTKGLAIQVRTRSESPERAVDLAREARTVTKAARIPVLLNGATQQAMDLNYEGVHWPEALIPQGPEDVTILRGASVHSPEAAARSEMAGAGFLVAGTVFDAGSKPARGKGLKMLSCIVGSTQLPVLAIGGVTPQRVSSCIAAGAAGVAVVTSVLRAPVIAAAVRDLREALDEAEVTGRFR